MVKGRTVLWEKAQVRDRALRTEQHEVAESNDKVSTLSAASFKVNEESGSHLIDQAHEFC